MTEFPDANANAAAADPSERFLSLLAASLAGDTFVKLLLSRYRGTQTGLAGVSVRRLALRGEDGLSFVHRYATRDVTSNLALPQALAFVRAAVQGEFDHAHLLTNGQDIQLSVGKKGLPLLRVGKAANAPAAQPVHDRAKRRFLDPTRPFLAALGVTDERQRVIPAMSRKWKQIDKFVEIFGRALASAAGGLAHDGPVRVVDFGSGKAYLTFAMHDYLGNTLGRGAEVTGVELREDLVSFCNATAERLGLAGLAFEQGDVHTQPPRPIDVMVALHACDTATDHAIHRGIRAGASVIMCSPCCHKQLRPQLLSPAPLRPIFEHGIHLGQEAEMVTDSLRALLLEANGYETQVFEFVALEHTSKNKMILAVKRDELSRPDERLRQIDALKAFYGIREHALETLLSESAAQRLAEVSTGP